MSSPVPAAPYAGNPSLPAEVREKILSTFRHALKLFSSGNVNDCLIGCEFILKMDPRFTPARQLQEKARNPYSNVDISDLEAAVGPGAPAGAPAPPAPPSAGPAAAPPAEKPDPQRLLAEAAKKYDTLDFEGAIAAATRALALLPGNTEALALIEKAAGRKATQPLIESARARAEQDIAEGRLPEARLGVERMRAIDPEAPAIPALERRLSASAAAAPPAGPATMPDFSLDPQGPDPFAPGSPEGGIFTGSSEPSELDSYSSRPSRPTDPPAAAEGGDSPAASSDLFLPPESLPPEDLLPEDLPAEEPELPRMPSLTGPPSHAEAEEARASKREIDALLKQGDDAARRGERQQAIEVWSRIFLIDINNADAVTRIEKARQEMADQGRLVADYLKRGRESFESGDHEGARKLFLQAQEIDPNEPTARLYLQRVEQAKGVKKPEAAEPLAAVTSAASAKTEEDLSEEPQAFPPIVAPSPPARRAALKVNPRVLGLIGAFLALTLVGVYFVFKGPKDREPPPKISSGASLQHARDLLAEGKVQEARAELRRIGPGDPDSAEARKMLADLGKPAAADAAAGKGAAPPEPPAEAARDVRADADLARLRDTAEKALAEKRYIEALKNFHLAAPAYRNDPTFSKELGLASDKVTALTPAVKLYNEGEFETAIPILWRIVQEDRDNRDARSYLLRSYYNQGISQLQNGLYPKAAQSFQEALGLDPNDAEAVRHKRFAERYQKGDLDLMGRIYVRHLNRRP